MKKKKRTGQRVPVRAADLSDTAATKTNVELTSSIPLAPWEVVEPVRYKEM